MMRHEQSEQRVFGKPVPWATLAAAVPAVVIAAGGAGFLVRLGFARGFGLSVDDVTASQTTLVATVALEGGAGTFVGRVFLPRLADRRAGQCGPPADPTCHSMAAMRPGHRRG